MKPTGALAVPSRFSRLVANLHPPTAPTPREATQLLASLQSSFKRQLDEKHPPYVKPESKTLYTETDSILQGSRQPGRHTSNYLDSILNHKSIDPRRAETLAPAEQFQKSILESTWVSAAHSTAHVSRCIRAYRVSDPDNTHVLQVSRFLLAWFQDAAPEYRRAVLENKQCLYDIRMLTKDAQDEASLWELLEIVYLRQGMGVPLDNSYWLQIEDRLVSQLVLMAGRRQSLHEAAEHFLQACRYRYTSGRPKISMRQSWDRIAIHILYRRQRHAIPEETFNALLGFAPAYTPSSATINHLLVQVYHPTNPTAQGLADSLREHGAQMFTHHSTNSKLRDRPFMLNLLDAAQVSLNNGQPKDARYILDFTIENYPKHLSRPQEASVTETSEDIEPLLARSFQLALT